MLSFLSPWFWFGALAVAVPFVLHLLRREEARRLGFTAVAFIERTPILFRARRRPSDWLLLALRMAAVLLLAVAFTRPYVQGRGVTNPATIVAVDISYSMDAPGRFEAARNRAADAIRRVPAGSAVGLVLFDDRARTVVEPVADRGVALAGVERLRAGVRGTDYRRLVDHVDGLLARRPGRLIVVTDLQREGWAAGNATTRGELDVTVEDVGGPVENIAITAAERTAAGVRMIAHNLGGRSRETVARLTVDDEALGDVRVTVPSGRAVPAEIRASLPTHGVARVTLDDPGGLPADDERVMLLDPPAPAHLLAIVGGTGASSRVFYLQRALEAASAGGESGLEVLGATAARDLTAEKLQDVDVVLLLGTAGVDRGLGGRLRDYARGGGRVLLAIGPDADVGVVSSLLAAAGVAIRPGNPDRFPVALAPLDARHPVFEAFGDAAGGLMSVRFDRAAHIEANGSGRVLAQFTNGWPALVELPLGDGRVLVFASDLNLAWNDFPVHAAFVPFVHEVTRYLARARRDESDWLLKEVAPEQADRPGVFAIGPRGRRVALNVDVSESTLDRESVEAFQAHVRPGPGSPEDAPRASPRGAESNQALWRYVLMLLAGLLVAESVVGRRRRPKGRPTDVPWMRGKP
ncbi:MAG: VWA domain-containing protein [Luteitalea sp.]|nr:VWA domain-containing protein [Luteitalea sp.]